MRDKEKGRNAWKKESWPRLVLKRQRTLIKLVTNMSSDLNHIASATEMLFAQELVSIFGVILSIRTTGIVTISNFEYEAKGIPLIAVETSQINI